MKMISIRITISICLSVQATLASGQDPASVRQPLMRVNDALGQTRSVALNSQAALTHEVFQHDHLNQESDTDEGEASLSQNDLIHAGVKAHKCTLPAGARWCDARLGGQEPFKMAVYDHGDIVSGDICNTGSWEHLDVRKFGKPGNALDIGGNVGFFTFALAHAGWNVSTYEPMASNYELMKSTVCQNPTMASRISLFNVGLGATPQSCQIISSLLNAGDGNTRCGESMNQPVPEHYAVRGKFEIHRLDDMLAQQGLKRIDFVKLDVEGYECQVFEGAPSLLSTFKPRLMMSEVWGHMQKCQPKDYLNMFVSAGYEVAKDVACTHPDMEAPGPGKEPAPAPGAIKNFWMCSTSQAPAPTQRGAPPSLLQSETRPARVRRWLLQRS